MFSGFHLKNNTMQKQFFETLDTYFFAFGRFSAINKLKVVPTGDVPSFVWSSDVISPSELYKRYNLGYTRELVCVHFLAALNVYLGGDKMISKNAVSEFFHNLSMQALSKSDSAIVIKFDAINRLNKSLNDFLTAESLAFETAKILRMTSEFSDRPIFVSDGRTDNKRIEENIVKNILND